jgi:hypothetical protein
MFAFGYVLSKLCESLNNIAVQGRLTTYCDRKKVKTRKSHRRCGKNREYSENPEE